MGATEHDIILINLAMNPEPTLKLAEAFALIKSVILSPLRERPEADFGNVSFAMCREWGKASVRVQETGWVTLEGNLPQCSSSGTALGNWAGVTHPQSSSSAPITFWMTS